MQAIITQFQAMKLFAHRAHLDVQGPQFFADHKALGKFYEAYDAGYDASAERCIGLGYKPDLAKIAKEAAEAAAKYPKNRDPKVLFAVLYTHEETLRKLCTAEMKDASEGTKNLLAQFCDESEQRCFLIHKRIAA